MGDILNNDVWGGMEGVMLIKDRGVDVSTFRRVDVKCKCESD